MPPNELKRQLSLFLSGHREAGEGVLVAFNESVRMKVLLGGSKEMGSPFSSEYGTVSGSSYFTSVFRQSLQIVLKLSVHTELTLPRCDLQILHGARTGQVGFVQ